jgi:predicted PilT family ATPase
VKEEEKVVIQKPLESDGFEIINKKPVLKEYVKEFKCSKRKITELG